MRLTRAWLAAQLVLSGGRLAALLVLAGGLSARTIPWTFRADFHHGFNGWMSYPLPQDIGFDPTLLVEEATLIRQLASVGQSKLSAGFIRPLHFVADAGTRIELRYSATWPSAGATMKLMLAGENGQRYEANLPAVGDHEVTVNGEQLRLPPSGVTIEAIVLVGRADQPASGANNRLTLQAFQLNAGRPADVPLKTPALLADTDRTRVSAHVIDPAEGLPIELASSPVHIRLTDGEGRTAVDRTFALPGRQSIALGAGARPGLWKAHLQTADDNSEFSFLVLGRIPGHPRVLLSAERLAQLRSAPEFASLRKQIHEQAQTQSAKLKDAVQAGAEIASLPPGSTLRASFDGELNDYFQYVESYSNAAGFAALDYALTGDATSRASARRDLLAVTRWPAWSPPRFVAHGMHIYYEAAIIAQRLAFAYDLIAVSLPASERQEVAEAFWTKCIQPTVEEYYRYNRIPTGASNWMSNSLGGAIAASIAVAGDVPGWRDREGVALAQLIAAYENNLRGLFPGDGGENEPAGYEHFAMQGLSWGAANLRALDVRPVGTEDMLKGFWWPDYNMVRPNLVLDTGDFNGEFRSLSGFAFGAEFAGIQALRAFYDRVDHGARVTDLLDLLCCTQASQPGSEPPLSRIFGERGSAVLRSGWGPDATVISLRAGPWFNHEHHDQGSFQVAAFGIRLISEAGYASYYLDPNYPRYFTQAPGHNTVLVDGDAFSQDEYDGPFWKALHKCTAFTGHLLSPRFDYVAADLAPAYREGLSAYTRQYLFLAPDVLIVRDDLQAAQPHVFTWLLHAAANSGVEANGRRARINAGTAKSDVIAGGPASAWEMRAMPVPAAASQILGNVVLHPGADRKAPRRNALCLSSPRSAAARFEVAMQFSSGSAATATLDPIEVSNASGFSGGGDVWALFRNAPGELRSHGLASDASVFAGRGTDNWIAIGTHTVKEGGNALLTASTAANAAWSRLPSGIKIDLHLDAPTTVAVHVARIAEVSVDGESVRYSEQSGRVQLPSLKQGEHRVWISTRAAL